MDGISFLFDNESGLYRPEVFRHLLEREVRRAFRYQEFLVLLLVDAGESRHSVSDSFAALRTVSENLRLETRATDLLGRVNGMLGIVLPCITVEDARLVAARVKARIEEVWQAQQPARFTPATIRIGGAGFPRGASSVERLLRASYDALKQAAARPGGELVILGERD